MGIYGKNFILLSIFEYDEKRRKFLLKHNTNKKTEIDALLIKDQDENKPSGQNTRKTFVEADYFIAMNKLDESITRFTNILFGYPYHTPSKDELNMALAWNTACRSADLSRQVGAAIANEQGDILAIGCNDVPKFGGGMFWEDDNPDHRDFQQGEDPNDTEKEKIIKDFISELRVNTKPDSKNVNAAYKKAKNKSKGKSHSIFNIIEYHRAVHGEEAAICNAARRGVSTKNMILYCTTFPCHLCTKHIIAAGIKKVVYIHPYPKSQTDELSKDLVVINPHDKHTDKVIFESFMGVAPRRILKVFSFEPDARKIGSKTIEWSINNATSPFLSSRTPLAYYDKETAFLNELLESINQGTKSITDLVPDEKLSAILTDAKAEFTDWDQSKKSWSKLEAEPPSKKK